MKIEFSSKFKMDLKRVDNYITLTKCILNYNKILNSDKTDSEKKSDLSYNTLNNLSVLQDNKFLNVQFSLAESDIILFHKKTEDDLLIEDLAFFYGDDLAFSITDDNSILLSQHINLFNIELPSYYRATINTVNRSEDKIDLVQLESFGSNYGKNILDLDNTKTISPSTELVSKNSFFRFFRISLGDEVSSLSFSNIDKYGNINKDITIKYEYSDFFIYTTGALKSSSETDYYVLGLDSANGGYISIKGSVICTKTYLSGSKELKTETLKVPIEKLSNVKIKLNPTNNNLFTFVEGSENSYIFKYEKTEEISNYCKVEADLYQQDGSVLTSNNIYFYYYTKLVVDDMVQGGYEDNKKVLFIDGNYGDTKEFNIYCYDINNTSDECEIICDDIAFSHFQTIVTRTASSTSGTVFKVSVKALQDNNTTSWIPNTEDNPHLITLNFAKDKELSNSIFNEFKFYAVQVPLSNFNLYELSSDKDLNGVIPSDNTISLPRPTPTDRLVEKKFSVMFDEGVINEDAYKYIIDLTNVVDTRFNVFSSEEDKNNIDYYDEDIEERTDYQENTLFLTFVYPTDLLNFGYKDRDPERFTIYQAEEGVTVDNIKTIKSWRILATLRQKSYITNIKGAPAIAIITNDNYLYNTTDENKTTIINSSDISNEILKESLAGKEGFVFKHPSSLHYRIWSNVDLNINIASVSSLGNYKVPSVDSDYYELKLFGGDNYINNPTNGNLEDYLTISKYSNSNGYSIISGAKTWANYDYPQFSHVYIVLNKLKYLVTDELVNVLNITSSEIGSDSLYIYKDFISKSEEDFDNKLENLESYKLEDYTYIVTRFNYYKADNLKYTIDGSSSFMDLISFHEDYKEVDNALSCIYEDRCYEAKTMDEDSLEGSYLLLSRDKPTYLYFKSGIYPEYNIVNINNFYPPYFKTTIQCEGKKMGDIKIYYKDNTYRSVKNTEADTRFFVYLVALYNNESSDYFENFPTIDSVTEDPNYQNKPIDIIKTTELNNCSNLSPCYNNINNFYNSEYYNWSDNNRSIEVINDNSITSENYYFPSYELKFSLFGINNFGGKFNSDNGNYKNIDINYNYPTTYYNHYFNYIYQLKFELEDKSIYYPVSIEQSCIKGLILARDTETVDKRNSEERFDRIDTYIVDDFNNNSEDIINSYNNYFNTFGSNNTSFSNFSKCLDYAGLNLSNSYQEDNEFLSNLEAYNSETKIQGTAIFPCYITKNSNLNLNKDKYTSKIIKLISGGVSPKSSCTSTSNSYNDIDIYDVISDNDGQFVELFFKSKEESSNQHAFLIESNYSLFTNQSVLDIFNINLENNKKFFDPSFTWSVYLSNKAEKGGNQKDWNAIQDMICKVRVNERSYIHSTVEAKERYYIIENKLFNSINDLSNCLLTNVRFNKFFDTRRTYTKDTYTDYTYYGFQPTFDSRIYLTIIIKSGDNTIFKLRIINQTNFSEKREEDHIYKYIMEVTISEGYDSFTITSNIPRIFKEYSEGPDFLSSRSVNPGTDYWEFDERNQGFSDLLRLNIPRPVFNKTIKIGKQSDNEIKVKNSKESAIILEDENEIIPTSITFTLKSSVYQIKSLIEKDVEQLKLLTFGKDPIYDISNSIITLKNFDSIYNEHSFDISNLRSEDLIKSLDSYNKFPIKKLTATKIVDNTEIELNLAETTLKNFNYGWSFENRLFMGKTIKTFSNIVNFRKNNLDEVKYIVSNDFISNLKFVCITRTTTYVELEDAVSYRKDYIKLSKDSDVNYKLEIIDNKFNIIYTASDKNISSTSLNENKPKLIIEAETPNYINDSQKFATTSLYLNVNFLPYFVFNGPKFFKTFKELYNNGVKFNYDGAKTELTVMCDSKKIKFESNEGNICNILGSELTETKTNYPAINSEVKELKLLFKHNGIELDSENIIKIAGLRLVIENQSNYGNLIVKESELLANKVLKFNYKIEYDTEDSIITLRNDQYEILDASFSYYTKDKGCIIGLEKGILSIAVGSELVNFNKSQIISHLNLIRINDNCSEPNYSNIIIPLYLTIE